MTEKNKTEKKLRECEKKLGEIGRLRLVEQSVIAGLREEGFSEKALELFRYRKNFLIGDPAVYEANVVGSFTGSCGDRVDIYLKIEENVIKDAKYTTDGCPGAVTSASAVTLLLIGKRIDESKNLNIKFVIEYLKRGQKSLPKHMYDCCGISIGSLKDAISKYETTRKKVNMKKILKKDIETILSKVNHPEINCSLVELGMIKDIEVKDAAASVTLVLPFLEIPIKEDLTNLIKKSIRNLDKNIKIKIKIAEMNEKEKERFMKLAREGWLV